MTATKAETYQAILRHHHILGEEVEERRDEVRKAAGSGLPHGPAVAEFVAYVAEEVLPHAAAEEETIYPAAAARPELAPTVEEMIAEHRRIAAGVDQLVSEADAGAAATRAAEITELFLAHVVKENDILLPPLVSDDAVDLGALLSEMQRLTHRHPEEEAAPVAASAGTEDRLVSLLLSAADDLADAGYGDRACRIAASAWTALRETRPDLAVKVTAALHRLARSATAEPVSFRSTKADADDAADPDLDVRPMAPAQRHETIFATYSRLAPGTGFVLVNDHDPKPLRYQFEAEHTGEFTWDVLEAGPEVWRVRIGRPHGPSSATDRAAAGGNEPELDVRELMHGRRHDVIFTAYRALGSGAGFVLVNDHDPRPLRYQFEAQHPGQFTWDYLESGPRIWKVRIGRTPVAAGR